MKLTSTSIFYIIFTIIVFTETVIANLNGLENLHYISKPLVVISLIFFFTKHNNTLSKHTKTFTTLALFFSLLGDVLLLFVYKNPIFFILGLLAFLMAHIMYCLVFFKHQDSNKKPYGFILLLLVYACGLFWLLNPGLDQLLIPVILYMFVILLMSTFAYLRQKDKSYNLVFIGAICFMVSDSLLALNKFYTPLPFADFSIMFTYALSQFLIVIGLLKHKQ